MLDPRGNTAVYLIYAYVRMCSIIRKAGMTNEEIGLLAEQQPYVITHPDERVLAGALIKFFDVVEEAGEEMAINKITDFIYEIAVKVQENYKKYRVVGDPNMKSRIILCECIRRTLLVAFNMVGIVPVDKI
jgi:arginyl-tRNA synthetase